MSSILCLLLIMLSWGCSLAPRPDLRYEVEVAPRLPEGGQYYIDPIDSSVVWSEDGVLVKVQFFDDQQLDAKYDPKISLYTLTGWESNNPFLDVPYTPPLWTVFEVTVINRTRESVELDPTQVVLRLDNGMHYYCAQGVGVYIQYPYYFNYAYLKWGGREGRVQYRATHDRNQLWHRTQYLREKPVRQGRRYSGKICFPPLPTETREFILEINNFILAFDRFEPGYGNPVEFTDLAFHFSVNQRVVEVVKTK